MGYVIASVPQASVEVRGTADRYPVHRIAIKSGDRIESGIEGLDALVTLIA